MAVSNGIKASSDDAGYGRSRIMLKESTYGVWSTGVACEWEKNLWGHEMGTTLPLPPVWVGKLGPIISLAMMTTHNPCKAFLTPPNSSSLPERFF